MLRVLVILPCLRCDRLQLSLFALHIDADRPDEAQELAPHCRHHVLLAFAPTEELPVTAIEAMLRFPSDALHLLAERRLAFP